MGLSKLVHKYKYPNPKHFHSADAFASAYKSPEEHPIEICIDIESPPCVLYGSATESSGSLLSGLLSLRVKNPYDSMQTGGSVTPVTSGENKRKSTVGVNLSNAFSNLSVSNSQPASLSPVPSSNLQIMAGYTKVTVTSVMLTLVQKVHFHKPFMADLHSIQTCMNCQSKTTNLKSWDIQKNSKDLPVGKYSFPFSCLISGSLPAKAALGSNSETQIKYELCAVVTYKDPRRGTGPHQKDQLLQLVMPVPVTRSLPRGPDKNSLRVFPPTELTATAVLPNVVYPKSTFPLEMKIEGISVGDRRWRMRKLTWRIDEITRIRNHACDVHKHELRKLEKSVKEKEDHKPKKPNNGLRRYGDQAPQVRVSVSTPDNTPLPLVPEIPEPQGQNRSDNAPVGDQDRDADDEAQTGFVHPDDDALRTEIILHQQRLREQQLQQELQSDSNLFTEEVRTVTKGDMKSGWKTDFDNNGQIELITEIDCMPLNSGVTNPITSVSTTKPQAEYIKQQANVACDIQDPSLGIYVSHILAVEVVVAEEALQYTNGQPVKKSSAPRNSSDQRLAELSPMLAARSSSRQPAINSEEVRQFPSGNSSQSLGNGKNNSDGFIPRVVSVPTGAARVLRMQFRIHLTERSGLGISWDEEVPPIYQDVKMLSPPSYASSVSNTPILRSTSPLANNEPTRYSENDVVPLMSSVLPTPPVAHHHDSSNSLRGITTVQSPQLDSVVSIQGNVPFQNNALTPHATRDIRIRSITELMDSDRITQ